MGEGVGGLLAYELRIKDKLKMSPLDTIIEILFTGIRFNLMTIEKNIF